MALKDVAEISYYLDFSAAVWESVHLFMGFWLKSQELALKNLWPFSGVQCCHVRCLKSLVFEVWGFCKDHMPEGWETTFPVYYGRKL